MVVEITKIDELRPNGVYALQVASPLSAELVERMRDDLAGQLPQNCKVLILDSSIEITPLADLLMGATIG